MKTKASLKGLVIELEANIPEIKVGDRVTWMNQSVFNGCIRMTSREGRVVEARANDVRVTYRGCRGNCWLSRDAIRLEGQKNAVTEAFEMIAGAVATITNPTQP